MAMEGVWSDHTEAALLILGLGSILTRQYLRAAKAWQEYGKGRGQKAQPAPTGWLTPPPAQWLTPIYSHPGPCERKKHIISLKS